MFSQRGKKLRLSLFTYTLSGDSGGEVSEMGCWDEIIETRCSVGHGVMMRKQREPLKDNGSNWLFQPCLAVNYHR